MSFLSPDVKIPEQPVVEPVPPTEEASVEIGEEEEEGLKKTKTGKSTLKLPLADTPTTGLRI